MDFFYGKFPLEVELHGWWWLTGLVKNKRMNMAYLEKKTNPVHPVQINQKTPSRHR